MYLYFLNWIKSFFSKKYISNKSATFVSRPRNIITISPSGFYGFYVMGVCSYIKDHYDTSNYVYSGASAGSWMTLILAMKGKSELMKDTIVQNDFYKNKSVSQVLSIVREKISNTFTVDDFYLERLYIGVFTLVNTHIYFDFTGLDDVLDCCIASSNIPFITGSLFYTYKNAWAYDGGFSENPYLDSGVLHIHPNIWGQNSNIIFNIYKKDYYNLEELYERGYQDTAKYGKETLDAIFK